MGMYAGRLRPRSSSAGKAVGDRAERERALREMTNDTSLVRSSNVETWRSGKKRERPRASGLRVPFNCPTPSSRESPDKEAARSALARETVQAVCGGDAEDIAWLWRALRQADTSPRYRSEDGRLLAASADLSPSRRSRLDTWCARLGLHPVQSNVGPATSEWPPTLHYQVPAQRLAALRTAVEAARTLAIFSPPAEEADTESDPDTPPHALPRTGSPLRFEAPQLGPRCDSLIDRMGQLNVLGRANSVTLPSDEPPSSTNYATSMLSAESEDLLRKVSSAETKGAPSSRRRRSSCAPPFLPLFDHHGDHDECHLDATIAKRFSFGRRDSTLSTASTVSCFVAPRKGRRSNSDSSSSARPQRRPPRRSVSDTLPPSLDDHRQLPSQRSSLSPPRSTLADRMQTPQHPCIGDIARRGNAAQPPLHGAWPTSTPAHDLIISDLLRHLHAEYAESATPDSLRN